MAFRHAFLQTYHLLSPNYFSEIEYGSQQILGNQAYAVCHILLGTENVDFMKWVKIRGITYNVEDLIVTSKRNNMPCFSRIKHIALQNNRELSFLIENLETIEYVPYFSGYKLQEIETPYKKFLLKNLLNLWPLDCYSISAGFKLVVPKYAILDFDV